MRVMFVAMHALAATGAFVAGALAIRPERAQRRPWTPSALVALVVCMLATMILATASHWADLDASSRSVFVALAGLGAYLVYRSGRAAVAFRAPPLDEDRYVTDIGFVLISLWNGFVIVTAIDLGASPWVVAAVTVVAVVLGQRSIHAIKRGLVVPRASEVH